MNGILKEKKYRYILFMIMLSGFLITRLFRLDLLPFGPHGMHIDEAGSAYDAVCIKNWGVDQFLVKYPPYFRGMSGSGQNALYTYAASLVFCLFGVSIFSFRLVAVFFATGAFVSLFYLADRLFEDKIYVFVTLSLMIAMPVYMMSEHWGLESFLFLSLSVISLSLTVLAVSSGKTPLFVFAGISWGITFYTYAISWIVIPLFLALSLIYLLYARSITIRQIIAMAIPVVLFGMPLLLQMLVMAGVIEPLHLGGMEILPTEDFRSASIGFSYIFDNLKRSTFILLVADDHLYNSNIRFGTMYYVSIPFMLTGLGSALIRAVRSMRDRKADNWSFIFLFYLSARLVSLITFEPCTNRLCALYLPLLLFTALGIRLVIDVIPYKKLGWGLVTTMFLISFLVFAKYFYSWSGYGADTDISMMKAPTELGELVSEVENEYNRNDIYVIANEGYANSLMMALFTETSPYDYKEGKINGCVMGVPDELDMSGQTVYIIDNDLHHITDYMETEGFTADRARSENFAVVYR